MSAVDRCAVCGRAGAIVQHTAGGDYYGKACRNDPECKGLLWESHFYRVTNASADSMAHIAWKWRRHRCEVEGKPIPPMPEDSIDKAARSMLNKRGLSGVA